MKRAMTLALLTGVTAGLTTIVAPAASAASDEYQGGCFLEPVNSSPLTAPNEYTGVLGDLSVTDHDTTDPGPVNAKVVCTLYVNGMDVAQATFGDGTAPVQAGAQHVTFSAGPADDLWLSTVVYFADGTVQNNCQWCEQVPPQWVLDDYNGIFTDINGVFIRWIDPAICPALVSLAGTYGPLTIGPDGDVNVPDPLGFGLDPVENCPPY